MYFIGILKNVLTFWHTCVW